MSAHAARWRARQGFPPGLPPPRRVDAMVGRRPCCEARMSSLAAQRLTPKQIRYSSIPPR